LQQAREILKQLEHDRKNSKSTSISNLPLFDTPSPEQEKEAKQKEVYEKVQRILSQADLNNMTPLQALQFLAKVKEEMSD
jgi:DNA mismatch repair ATPase MutS